MSATFSAFVLLLLSLSHNEAAPVSTASVNRNSDDTNWIIVVVVCLFLAGLVCCWANGQLECKHIAAILN